MKKSTLLPGRTRAILCTEPRTGGVVNWFSTNSNALDYANKSDAFPRTKYPQIYIITVMVDKNGMSLGVTMTEKLYWNEEEQTYRAASEWANEDQARIWTEFMRNNWDDIRALRGFVQ